MKTIIRIRKVIKACVLSLLVTLYGLSVQGQVVTQAHPVTYMDWTAMCVDTVPPVYTEVVPLESDPSCYDYAVRMIYPEWKVLTRDEAALASRWDSLVADSLMVRSQVGMSRKRGLLDISFIPLRRVGDRLERLVSATIEIVPQPKATSVSRMASPMTVTRAATGRQRWASESVLATGRWAKISVTEEGIYHLTNAALRSMGFANPANVRVYGYGGHLQDEAFDADSDWDDLEEVALLPVSDGYLFHARGLQHWKNGHHVLNHYARAACYFVTEATTAATAIAVGNAGSTHTATTKASTIDAHAVIDPQQYAWYWGGRRLYEDYDYVSGARQYTLALPTYTAEREASLTISFSAASDEAVEVKPTYNGKALASFSVDKLYDSYSYAMLASKTYTVSAPLASNTVRIASTSGAHARLHYMELNYSGLLKIDSKVTAVQFESSNAGFVLEYDEGQQPQLWRLAEPGKPAVSLQGSHAELSEDGRTRHFLTVAMEDDGESHQYIAFDAAVAYPAPSIVGTLDNQNLHAMEAQDMVIITPASGKLDAEAERLAEAHRAMDGMRVVVVRADQIYNEFSSGTPDATAYRRLMKMLYDRAKSETDLPRYLLLFGDCAWDNRLLSSAWRSTEPDDMLLCYENGKDNADDDIRTYVMEDYFGLLDDGEGGNVLSDKTDIGVGRFPVRTVSEARAVVDKTIAYMQGKQSGAWKNVVSFLGDDGDNNDHLIKADNVANYVSNLYPQLEVRKVMWDAYPRQTTSTGNRYPQVTQIIKEQMDEGALMMNYTGHGANYCLSHEQVLRVEDFGKFTSPRMPLWVTAACDVMPFDTHKENIGETAFLNPNGAAVAFYGTTRTVYASLNLDMNRYFCRYVFGQDELGRPSRLGDAVRMAKCSIIAAGESFYKENKLQYALLGDPALRLGGFDRRIVLDSINGKAVNELADDYTLHAGGRMRLSGHVEDAEGVPATSFTGTVNVRLYDSPSTITCLNNEKNKATPFTFTTHDKILYNGSDSIRAGRFSLTCPVPIDISYSGSAGRLLFYALANDHIQEANGYSEDFLLGGTEPGLTDTEGPRIEAWLGSDTFNDGDVVGATPYFVANLEDESGINTAGNGVGHDLELVIDSAAALTYSLNDYFTNAFGDYRKGSVAFSIPTLPAGEHSLLFRAWDTLNNSNTATLHFTVDPSLAPSLLDVVASISPATVSTTFLLSYNRPGSLCRFTLEIFDFTGRLLWTHTEEGSNDSGLYSIPWNLTTGSGMPLGSGVYLYRVRLACDESEEVSKTRKIIVNRRK